MREKRWFPIAVIAVALFAINAVTRVVIRLWFHDSDSAEDRASLVMFALIGLALVIWTFLRAQRERPSDWLPTVAFGAAAGLLLTVLVGPFISGDQPFAGGAGSFFSQVWLYGGFAIAGVLIGYWIATALGRDYKSQSLRAFARARASKPRRVVRR